MNKSISPVTQDAAVRLSEIVTLCFQGQVFRLSICLTKGVICQLLGIHSSIYDEMVNAYPLSKFEKGNTVGIKFYRDDYLDDGSQAIQKPE